jgi:hypothetical protein
MIEFDDIFAFKIADVLLSPPPPNSKTYTRQEAKLRVTPVL